MSLRIFNRGSRYLFYWWNSSKASLSAGFQGQIETIILVHHRIQRNKFQTKFILYVFDDCFQLLSALLHIFSYFFYAHRAKQVKNRRDQEAEFYQSHQESDHQMFLPLIYSNQMDFSSFFPTLFIFSLMTHLFIFWHSIYLHTLGLYHLVDRFCLLIEF